MERFISKESATHEEKLPPSLPLLAGVITVPIMAATTAPSPRLLSPLLAGGTQGG